MGILNLNIEYLTFSKKEILKDFDCYNCKVQFDNKDLGENNFIVGVDDNASELKKEGGTYLDQRQPFYTAILQVKGGKHKNCPLVERCEECLTRKRTDNMQKLQDDNKWYCLDTCWQDKTELRRDAVETKSPSRKKEYGRGN